MPSDNTARAGESPRYESFLISILFLTWGTVFLDRMSQLYLAPYFAPEFRLDNEQIGFLASVTAIAWAISGFFFGALSDRYGRRPVLVPAIFLFSALSWMSGMVHSFTQLLVVRALLGVAEGPCWAIITAIIEESSPPNRRGHNVGIVVSAAALVGLSAAPILSTQVAARFGWRWAFFVAGIPGIVMGLMLWKFVKEPASRGGHVGGHSHAPLAEYLLILRFRNMWLSCLGSAGFMCWLFLLNVFAPLYITGVMHEPGTTAGFLLGAGGLGSFFLSFVFPALSDRIGPKAGADDAGGDVGGRAAGPAGSRLVQRALAAGRNSAYVQRGPGNRVANHRAGAGGNCSAAISCHGHWTEHAGRRSDRSHGCSRPGWSACGKSRTARAAADVGGGNGSFVPGRARA